MIYVAHHWFAVIHKLGAAASEDALNVVLSLLPLICSYIDAKYTKHLLD